MAAGSAAAARPHERAGRAARSARTRSPLWPEGRTPAHAHALDGGLGHPLGPVGRAPCGPGAGRVRRRQLGAVWRAAHAHGLCLRGRPGGRWRFIGRVALFRSGWARCRTGRVAGASAAGPDRLVANLHAKRHARTVGRALPRHARGAVQATRRQRPQCTFSARPGAERLGAGLRRSRICRGCAAGRCPFGLA